MAPDNPFQPPRAPQVPARAGRFAAALRNWLHLYVGYNVVLGIVLAALTRREFTWALLRDLWPVLLFLNVLFFLGPICDETGAFLGGKETPLQMRRGCFVLMLIPACMLLALVVVVAASDMD